MRATIIVACMLAAVSASGAWSLVPSVSPDGETVMLVLASGDGLKPAEDIVSEAIRGAAIEPPKPKTISGKIAMHLENNWGKYLTGIVGVAAYGLVANNNGYWPFEKSSGSSAGRDANQTQTTDRNDRAVTLTLSSGGDMNNVNVIVLQNHGAPESMTQGASSPVTVEGGE
jgi:hypothetical protein